MSRRTETPLWVGALLDKSLPPHERIVLIALAWHQGGHGRAWPSEGTLAAELGISERSVRRAIQSLNAKGRLAVTRPAQQGRGMANTYTVTPTAEGGQPCPPSEGQKADTADPLSNEKGGQPWQKRGSRMSSQHIRNTEEACAQILYDANTRRFSGVSDQQKSDWTEAFPGVEVERELVRAAIWWHDNPRKQKKDIRRFLSNWMSRAARGFPERRGQPQPTAIETAPAPIVRDADGLTPRDRVLAQMGGGK